MLQHRASETYEERVMTTFISTSLRAIMPQSIAVGDISVTFNGDGWIVAVMLLIGIVLCGRR